MGLTIRGKKQVNSEIYLEQDGDDINIRIATPEGLDQTVAYFSDGGQFYTYGLDDDEAEVIKKYVVLDDNVLSVC
jgi:hypothetical protein